MDGDAVRAKERERYHKAGEKKREQMRASRRACLDKRQEYDRRRYHDDRARRDWQKQQATQWAKDNKGKRNHIIAKRRSWIKHATPPWLTAEHFAEIRDFYLRASERGLHVDHIHPLRGKFLCGLHVPWNLQLLTKIDNIKKGNKHEA